MTDDSAGDGAELDDAIEEWPTRSMAARLMGVTPRTIDRWAISGQIRYLTDDQGVRRYNPEDVQARQGTAESGDIRKALADAHKQSREIVELMVRHQRVILDSYTKTIERQTDRIGELESRAFDVVRLAEELLSQRAEREREELRTNHSLKVRGEAWDWLREKGLPAVVDGLAGPGRALLQSLQPAQVQALLESDFLTDEQRAALGSVIPTTGAEAPSERPPPQ